MRKVDVFPGNESAACRTISTLSTFAGSAACTFFRKKSAGRTGKPARPAELYQNFYFLPCKATVSRPQSRYPHHAKRLSHPAKRLFLVLQDSYPRLAKPLFAAPQGCYLRPQSLYSPSGKADENFRRKPLLRTKILLLYPKTGIRPPKIRFFLLPHRRRKGVCPAKATYGKLRQPSTVICSAFVPPLPQGGRRPDKARLRRAARLLSAAFRQTSIPKTLRRGSLFPPKRK